MLTYDAHTRPSNTRLVGRLCGMLLVLGMQREAHSQTPSWKTYTDTLHGYQFNYPADYEIQGSGSNFSLQQRDAGTESEFYIEDWTRPVRRGETPWEFVQLGTERALTACLADSPDCSISCSVRGSEEVPNEHHMRILAITRNELDTCKRGVTRTLAPIYIVDLSRDSSYLLLVVDTWPNRRGVAPHVLRSIVATIRRVEP